MKWVLRISILILLLAVVAVVWLLLKPTPAAMPVAGWCCISAGSSCQEVGSYQECAGQSGKIYHAEQTTCDTLCSLLPVE